MQGKKDRDTNADTARLAIKISHSAKQNATNKINVAAATSNVQRATCSRQQAARSISLLNKQIKQKGQKGELYL